MKVRFFKGIDLSKSHHSCGLKKKKQNKKKQNKNKHRNNSVSVGAGKGVRAISAGRQWKPGADQALRGQLGSHFKESTGSEKASASQQGDHVKTALLAPWRRVWVQKREQMAGEKVWGELAACLHINSCEDVRV